MLFGEAGLGYVPLGGTLPDTGLLIGIEFSLRSEATIGVAVAENGETVAVIDSSITAVAVLGSVTYELLAFPPGIAATAVLGAPDVRIIADPQIISAAASLNSPSYAILATVAMMEAAATLGAPIVSVVIHPTVVAATAVIGIPTWIAIAKPYPILSWARLDPILALGYAAAADTTVIVFNANTLAATEYSIDALDVVSHDGELYFVLADGLVKLAADAAGVAGSITTGDLELSDGSISLNLTRLELEADGELHITTTAHQDGGQRSTRYLVPKRTGANERDRNVKLGNGVLGNDWSFTIAPPAGQVCNWSLGGWKIEPGQSKLRRR